ncbi:MAG: protein kinase domain-containing protein, partial [Thermoanaerobaculia bacterium]
GIEMTILAGSRLGPYEIQALLGAGGMGEVYRARDTRLNRTVAVKVLPAGVASSEELRQRFEREAQSIAQLSHPHICALYDVGREGETEFLVMELLEGETLAERLARGPLPIGETLRFGAEIASALDGAHRKGIVHRDLKPGNVMLTASGVKLLDFGLAKVLAPEGPIESLTSAPTAGKDVTREGAILGTLSSMAPEQLEGKPADQRADIFALGAVLYEMATGRKAFSGASQASLISAILSSEPPPLTSVQPFHPPALDRVVRTCLAKDPGRRWQAAHDVGLQLAAIAEASPAPAPGAPVSGRRRPVWLPWAVAAACLAAAILALLRGRAPAGRPAPVVRFAVAPPSGRAFFPTFETTELAVSPDGSRIAFVATGGPSSGPSATAVAAEAEAGRGIWVRDLSQLEARPVAGTEGASSVFWSPDGKTIGFFTPGSLKRIEVSGGAPVPICDLPVGGGRSGTWGAGGDILFTNIQKATISRVPAAGGTPETLIEGDASRGEMRLNWPWFLPDGKRFLYVLKLRDGGGKIMLWEPGKPPRALLPVVSAVQYIEPGYLVFAREGVLLAQRFDWRKGTLTGEPFSIAERVAYFLTSGHASFAVSQSGTLAYQSHDSVSRIVWLDRAGRELGTVGPPGNYFNLSVAPDGRRLFYDRTQPGIGTFDVWSFDLERQVEGRVTSSPLTEFAATELPGRRDIVYSSSRGGQPQLYRLDPASGREEQLAPGSGTFQIAQDVSPDGSTLVYVERTPQSPFDIWTLPLSGAGKPTPLLQSPFSKSEVRFSRDGRFLSFISDESGRLEAYVMPYPGPGERIRVSTGGARLARWSRDGRELFYLSLDRRLMSVPVRTGPSLQLGTPVELFALSGRPWINFETAPDGKRFLASVPDVIAGEQPLTVVLNWAPESGR